MEVHPLPAPASAIAGDLRRLTKLVVEKLQDPSLFGDPTLESSIDLLLDRLCLSVRLSKPLGLANWAVREGRRLGASRTAHLSDAAAHVIANEAGRFDIDLGRLLALLEVLKAEMQSALSPLGERPKAPASEYSETAHALLALLGERDLQTCCHSKATGEWARRICTWLSVSKDQAEFIELSAILHDVGKISTPEEILFKRGALTTEEWAVMREHAEAGQRILEQIPSLSLCGTVVRSHHERWDGLGYPDGLAGENIPFEARVVAVADAFHAMISDRPYRKAMAPRRALAVLESGIGTQWDPLIVDAMLGLFNKGLGNEQTPLVRVSIA